jgi:mevalonate kinase
VTPAPSIGAAPDHSDPYRARRAAEARAPGKLILMGEHSVVYGEPALVAALGLHLTVRIEPAPSRTHAVRIELPLFDHAETTDWTALRRVAEEEERKWTAFAEDPERTPFATIGGDGTPARLVRIALGEAARRAPSLPACRVEIAGDLPAGSGFGSSAALAVGVLSACRAFGMTMSDAELEAAALDVERRQHGRPSGVDAATVLRGGVLWAERTADGELAVRPANPDPEHLARFRIAHTGVPAQSTGAIVDAVRATVEDEGPHARARLTRMGSTTREFRRVIEGGGGAGDALRLIRAYHADLTALGVVPARIRALVEEVERAGGGAKISGAGARAEGAAEDAGAGSLLLYHPDSDWFGAWTPPPGVVPVEAALGVAGVEVRA